jgi:hypothetical protein
LQVLKTGQASPVVYSRILYSGPADALIILSIKLTDVVAVCKQPRLQPDNAKRRLEELTARLEQRKKELGVMANVVSSQPVVIGVALAILQGLLAQSKGETLFTTDAAARRRIEQIAIQAVIDVETRLGHSVKDVSKEKCGWDITSQPPTPMVNWPQHDILKSKAALKVKPPSTKSFMD